MESIRKAFHGSTDESGYLATGEDLGVDVRWFPQCPRQSPAVHLNGALHSFVVVLATARLASNGGYRQWIDEATRIVQESEGRHRLIVLAESETTVESFVDVESRLPSAQFLSVYSLGEQATRPAHFGLIVLNEASRVLSRKVSKTLSRQHLFISHAKKDGLPLAMSILHQLDTLPQMTAFYDAGALQLTDDWRRDLENGIAASVVIVLRTDEYDRRPFCIQELRWADIHGCPIVIVEAGNRLSRSRTDLPMTNALQIVLRDGNLLRVIYAALREGLRAVLLSRQVTHARDNKRLHGVFRVLHRLPSLASIRHVCEQLRSDVTVAGERSVVIYPEPILPTDVAESLSALANHYLPGVRLLTLGQLATGMEDE